MKVIITDHTKNNDGDSNLPKLLRSKVYDFAWRYETGVYQLANYPTKTFLYDSRDEQQFMSGKEVWIHLDEVSIKIV